MPARAERSWPRLWGRALAAALAALVVIPAYLAVPPAWRPVAARLACAVVVAMACARVVRGARGALGPPAPSPLDALPPAPPALALDARFIALREDVIAGTRSRRYFDVILWPRLRELAGGDLARPAERRGMRRRGPALRELAGLVADIERRA